jgi:hypothetical protein
MNITMKVSIKGALAILLCAGLLNAQDSKDTKSVPPQIAKEFRKAALLSVEAERRQDDAGLDVMIASGPMSSDADRREKESEYAAINLDTSKQLTEVRIEMESSDEKNIYALLKSGYQMTVTSAGVSWPSAIKIHARKAAARCRMEVLTIIDPEEVNESLRNLASDVACLAASEAVSKETVVFSLANSKAAAGAK